MYLYIVFVVRPCFCYYHTIENREWMSLSFFDTFPISIQTWLIVCAIDHSQDERTECVQEKKCVLSSFIVLIASYFKLFPMNVTQREYGKANEKNDNKPLSMITCIYLPLSFRLSLSLSLHPALSPCGTISIFAMFDPIYAKLSKFGDETVAQMNQ